MRERGGGGDDSDYSRNVSDPDLSWISINIASSNGMRLESCNCSSVCVSVCVLHLDFQFRLRNYLTFEAMKFNHNISSTQLN